MSKLGKQVALAVATSPITVPGTIFAAVAGSLAFLSIHTYRGAKVLGNVYGSIKQLETGEEYIPFQFGPNLVKPLKSTFNSYSDFIRYWTDIDLGQQKGGTYKPHPLDPTYDPDPDVVLKTGLMQAEKVVIDFINSGGMTYNIALTANDNAKLYVDTRKKTLTDIASKIQTELSTPTSEYLTTLPMTAELTSAKQELDNFNTYLGSGVGINPIKYFDHFQSLHSNITEALDAQLEADQKQIGDACGTDEPLKIEMLKILNDSHTKQLEELNKKFEDDKKSLQDAANQENNRIFFLAQVLRQNPHLKDTFQKLSDQAAAKRIPTGSHAVTSATLSTDPVTISFAGIDPKDLLAQPGIKAFGTNIRYDKDKNQCSMELSLFNRGFGLEDKNKHRIVMLVKAIKATSGGEKIKLTVDHGDPEYALYLARKMYEACREEGYKENGKKEEEQYITIVCNGKTLSLLDSEKKQDKDGRDIPGEQGLLRSEAEKQAIQIKADAYKAQKDTNFGTLKKQIQSGRETAGNSLAQEIAAEIATRSTVSSPSSST